MLRGDILQTILMIPAILLAFTFHEFAHAITADRLGDKTPRFQGRLTLNPIAHIDPIGFIMILILGFGWAKPVQTNPSAFKNYYKDDLKVSLAGPMANMALAFIFSIILALFLKSGLAYNQLGSIIHMIIYYTAYLNCVLLFLNLIPIPGFDGFHILRDLFPKAFYNMSDAIYRHQLLLFMALILPILPGRTSVFSYIVGVPANLLFSFFRSLAGML